jgi:hypothetical protein
MLQVEIDAALKEFLTVAATCAPQLVRHVLFAASIARGDLPPSVSKWEVSYVCGNMPSLSADTLAASGALAAYTELVTAFLAMAEYARAHPDSSSSGSSLSQSFSSSSSSISSSSSSQISSTSQGS